ncbi:TVP38/TMEM64 family protein [Paenibacillus wulumuqiensis]|uniref:TVP38/TMEM64 family protein n=1 Tax=Paenibacillus wulumuqiensis TaxID=1567107 RepID=UPI000619A8EC|nr:TVP38/TMEM64 family protein [Paenibacillus wulumuqiensis]
MDISELLSAINEENLRRWMNDYRSLGPLISILIPFLKSFIPPMPTIVVLGVNAAVYGLWMGFVYSYIGIIGGSLTAFALIRKLSQHRYLARIVQRPRVERTRRWVRDNGFNYVFLLSLFPVGPFTLLNLAAGLSGIRFRSFLIAILFGRGVMVFAVSFIGADFALYWEQPWYLVWVVIFIVVCLVISRRIEAYFSRKDQHNM